MMPRRIRPPMLAAPLTAMPFPREPHPDRVRYRTKPVSEAGWISRSAQPPDWVKGRLPGGIRHLPMLHRRGDGNTVPCAHVREVATGSPCPTQTSPPSSSGGNWPSRAKARHYPPDSTPGLVISAPRLTSRPSADDRAALLTGFLSLGSTLTLPGLAKVHRTERACSGLIWALAACLRRDVGSW
jgi:hypothetical protein